MNDELDKKLASFTDLCYLEDWGRDFGIDTRLRVRLICNKLAETYSLSTADDRFVRRYLENGSTKPVYDFALERNQQRQEPLIVVVLEKRVKLKSELYLSQLHLPRDFPYIDMSDMNLDLTKGVDDLYRSIEEKIFPPIYLAKEFVLLSRSEAFFEAIQTGNNDFVSAAFVSNQFTPDTRDLFGRTPLHLAVLFNNQQLFDLCFQYSVGIDANDKDGNTALHLACETKAIYFVRVLLDFHSSVNHVNHLGQTALHLAVSVEQNLEVVQLLLDHQANLTANVDGESAMDCACNEETRNLLTLFQHRITTLLRLVIKQDVEGVKDFLQSQTLVAKQMYLDYKNEDGRSSLYFAAGPAHNIQIVKLLLSHGASSNLLDNWNDTPLSVASLEHDDADIAEILLIHGVNINNVNTFGDTALFLAAQRANVNIFKLLLQHNADTSIAGSLFPEFDQKFTVIELCYQKELFGLVEILLNAGAFVHTTLLKTILVERQATNIIISITALKINSNRLWFQIIEMEDFDGLEELLSHFLLSFPELVLMRDNLGRVANAIANEKSKKLMNSIFLWFGKYRPITLKPDHYSFTSYVYRAYDESATDDQGNYLLVALKLMRYKSHFMKEALARQQYGLEEYFTVKIIDTYPSINSNLSSLPDIAPFLEFGEVAELSKLQVEKLYCVVMPLADRNLFVSMKQERFAGGSNLTVVKDIFRQLAHCAQHFHSKGLLHRDIKPLNIMRIESLWKLIDFDASCSLFHPAEPVGKKCSSAYVPPEVVYWDVERKIASIKVPSLKETKETSSVLAHPSFDIWSLGCILYQLCNKDVIPLFQGGQDDNLTDDAEQEDNLQMLAVWSSEYKQKKLSRVENAEVRNLISLMLMKDPEKRATMARILSHPFLTGKSVIRLSDSPPRYDVFISYRVASDLEVAKELYHRLTNAGYRVWWDKMSLEMGKNWKEGFCQGLMDSRAFICLLSKEAINHPTSKSQNLSCLHEKSECDNLLLEIRLALEFHCFGYIHSLIPIFIHQFDQETSTFLQYSRKTCWPSNNDVIVYSLEESVQKELEEQSVGDSMNINYSNINYLLANRNHPSREKITVTGLLKEFTKRQGNFFEGQKDQVYQRFLETLDQALDNSLTTHSAVGNLETRKLSREMK